MRDLLKWETKQRWANGAVGYCIIIPGNLEFDGCTLPTAVNENVKRKKILLINIVLN